MTTGHTRTDQEWLAALRAEQMEAYQDLWRYLYRVVYNLCLRRVADLPVERQLALAEESTQEGLLQIWRKLDAYRGEGPFLAWATRIAANKFRDRLRHERPWQVNTEIHEIAQAIETQNLEPEIVEILEQAIKHLTPRERAVIVGRLLEERSSEEVADALNISRGNERIIYLRARQKIQIILIEQGYKPP